MKFDSRFASFYALLMLVCVCKPADAALVLGFSDNGGQDFSSSFDIGTGESITISVFLLQTAPDTVLTEKGILTWGFDLSTPTTLGTISNAQVDSAFGFEAHNLTTATGFQWEYGETSGFGVKDDDIANAIALGSFHFDSTMDGASLFTVQDRVIGSGSGSANWTLPFDVDPFAELVFIDEQIFGAGATNTFQFSVNSTTAVPEPSSLAMLSCAAGLACLRRRRQIPNSGVSPEHELGFK